MYYSTSVGNRSGISLCNSLKLRMVLEHRQGSSWRSLLSFIFLLAVLFLTSLSENRKRPVGHPENTIQAGMNSSRNPNDSFVVYIHMCIYAVGLKMLSKFRPCVFFKYLILPAEPSMFRVKMLAILRVKKTKKKKMASILTVPWPAF